MLLFKAKKKWKMKLKNKQNKPKPKRYEKYWYDDRFLQGNAIG